MYKCNLIWANGFETELVLGCGCTMWLHMIQFNDCPRKLHVIFLDVSKLALDIMKQMMYQSYSDDVPSPSKKGKLS